MATVAFTVQLIRYAQTATCTLFTYEFLFLVDREYKAIYKARWSLTKFLYLACRFTPLIGMPIIMYSYMVDHDIDSCKSLVSIVALLHAVFPCFPHSLFVLRAWAFTGAKRWTLFIYLPSLFAYVFIVFWHSLYRLRISKELFLILGRTGCFKAKPEPEIINGRQSQIDYSRRLLIASMVLDFVVGLMVAIHCIWERTPRARLGRLLVTQGLLYFPLMFSLTTLALIIASVGSFRGYDILGYSVVFVMTSILACRFVLQIKEYDPTTHEILSRVRPEFQPSDALSTPEAFAALSNRKKVPSFYSQGFRNSNIEDTRA